MGRRKGSKNKRTKNTSNRSYTKSNTFLNEFIGGLTVVLGLALATVFMFDGVEGFSNYLNNVFTGLFGYAKYVLIFVCIYVGIFAICSSKKINILKV